MGKRNNLISSCIIFKGYTDKDGYGILPNGERAHRNAYKRAFGLFKRSLYVCHKCDNPPCINPKHLFLGTNTDNMRDKMLKGRHTYISFRGEANPRSKLNNQKVARIRKLYKSTEVRQAELARIFKVSQCAISNIVRKKTWYQKEV